MNKIYCSRCVYIADEAFFAIYQDIKFRDSDRKITHGTNICVAKKEISVSYESNYVEVSKNKTVVVDDPSSLNKNNNCPYFKYNILWPITEIIRNC